jgi:hypothetical protein
VAYLLINDGMPTAYVNRFGTSSLSHLAPSSVKRLMGHLRPFFVWLEERGIESLSGCSVDALGEYLVHVTAQPASVGHQRTLLGAVEKLHYLAPLLPEGDRLAKPPYEARDFRARGSEAAPGSARSVLLPGVADPLLYFAITCVRSLADDIFMAVDTARDMRADPPDCAERPIDILRRLASVEGIPGRIVGRAGEFDLAADYLAATYGVLGDSLSQALRKNSALQSALNADLPCPVPSPVVGRIGDILWADHVDWYDAIWMGEKRPLPPVLLKHLQVACWIVLADLTGARPEEVRTLPRAAHEAIEAADGMGPVRHVLKGIRRKGVLDDDGRASKEGLEKRWVISGPGVDAVAVAESVAQRISPDSRYLFAGPTDDAISHDLLVKRVRGFVEWANDLMVSRAVPEALHIPTDPGQGALPTALASYRRSMAHFMYRRPRGEIATAFQFGHQREIDMGDGYANTSDAGYRNVVTQAKRQAYEETLAEVAEALTVGTTMSGPAANRLAGITSEMLGQVEAAFITEREVARLLADADVPVFDSPTTYSLCMYDPRLAKCLGPSERDAPEPDRSACDASCACILRTDAQAEALLAEAEESEQMAASPLTPEPLAHRLRDAAQRKRERIEEHRARGVFVSVESLRESLPGVGPRVQEEPSDGR